MTPDRVAKLIVRVSLRDRTAFDHLYQHTSAKLFGVCLRVLKDRSEAEDALQEVFVKVWRKADRFAVSEQSPISWLVAIARNHAIDRLRTRKPETGDPDVLPELADQAPGPEESAIRASERAAIETCMEELEEARASAVRSAYLDGDSYAELAERHAVPLNTMRTWLRRSLLKLRDCLQR